MSFFTELKRRNVIKVAAAYIIVSWLIMQIAEVMAPALYLPDWVDSFVALLLILGLPIALILAWALELTPEGLRKEKSVDRSRSTNNTKGRKLDFVIIGLLVVALGYFAYDKFVVEQAGDVELATSPAQSGAAVVSAETAIDQKSIAVLPFANRSNLEEDLFFTDGIHDDLLTQLAKINDLKVISRTSVMNYRDTTRRIPEIAAELGVAMILEGGVQRAGKRIRINAQLIDVATDEHLWAETFDREMTVENIFEIQSEIARQIVTAVRGELSTEEAAALAKLPTRSPEAYEAWMRAVGTSNELGYNADKYRRAQQWAEKAVAIDPEFWQAWALLSRMHGQAVWIGADVSSERRTAAREALDKALAGDPDSGSTLLALGQFRYRFEADYPAALEAFEAASVLLPGDVNIIHAVASTLRRLGRFDDAVRSYEKALLLDPSSQDTLSEYMLTLLFQGDFEKTITIGEQAILRFPQALEIKSHLAKGYLHGRGDLVRAGELLDQMTPQAGYEYVEVAATVPLWERDYDQALAVWEIPEVIEFADFRGNAMGWRGRWKGEIYLLRNEPYEATEVLQAFIENDSAITSLTVRHRTFRLMNIALAQALLGDSDTALTTIEEALAANATTRDVMVKLAVLGIRARILALGGHRDKAISELEALVDETGSYANRQVLALDPRWDFMRDDERFNVLARSESAE